jgi:hypothetical protein
VARAWLIIVGSLFFTPAVAVSAAGLSDIAATRACWIRDPYALVKCQSEGGRYPARLVRARVATADENSFWTLFPPGYDGIVPLSTVVEDIDRVAITTRFLVARERSGVFSVVALDKPDGEPTRFPSIAGVNEFLAQVGGSALAESEFVPFEDAYQASRPPYSPIVLLVQIGVVASGAVLLLVVWRRRSQSRNVR